MFSFAGQSCPIKNIISDFLFFVYFIFTFFVKYIDILSCACYCITNDTVSEFLLCQGTVVGF